MEKLFLDVEDVRAILGVSKATAYRIIRDLNEQLKNRGYITIAGKVPKKYLLENCYGVEVTGITQRIF